MNDYVDMLLERTEKIIAYADFDYLYTFFRLNPKTPEEYATVWHTDNNIFFSHGMGEATVHIADDELDALCKQLELITLVQVDGSVEHQFKNCDITIEKDVDGYRNFCLSNHNSYLIFNLESKRIPSFISFLRTSKN